MEDGGKADGVMSAEGVRICLGQGSLGNRAQDVKVQWRGRFSSRKLVLCPIGFCFLAEKVVGHLLIRILECERV